MACHLGPDACRAAHIAGELDSAEQDGADYEARCPVCGHDSFRVSAPDRARYRNIWTCACKNCRCTQGAIRVALLKRRIPAWCLGSYGQQAKEIDTDTARRMDMTISDILAAPHLKPSDMRIALAEAQGQKIPAEYTEFVKFAKGIGIGHQQAYEAARRWLCRPSDSPPTGGRGVVDTSRNTGA